MATSNMKVRDRRRSHSSGCCAGTRTRSDTAAVLLAEVMEAAHDAALEQAPERIDSRGVNDASHVLILAMVYRL